MSTHTPGPWTQHMNEITDIVISGNFQRGKHGNEIGDLIATVSCGMNKKQAANASLIAAAPALLGALKEIDLRTTQARIASGIGKKKDQTEFLLGELERIKGVALNAIAQAEGNII